MVIFHRSDRHVVRWNCSITLTKSITWWVYHKPDVLLYNETRVKPQSVTLLNCVLHMDGRQLAWADADTAITMKTSIGHKHKVLPLLTNMKATDVESRWCCFCLDMQTAEQFFIRQPLWRRLSGCIPILFWLAKWTLNIPSGVVAWLTKLRGCLKIRHFYLSWFNPHITQEIEKFFELYGYCHS